MAKLQLKLLQKKPKKSAAFNQYAKYSGMAFQMIVIILGGAMLGKYLDQILNFEKPLCTVFLALLSIGMALYIALKDFIGNHEN